jgi:hypothetical protein
MYVIIAALLLATRQRVGGLQNARHIGCELR